MKKLISLLTLKIKAEPLISIFSQTKGFMFTLNKKNSKLFIFDKEKNISIHMLFVFFPIIAIWLNSGKKIVHFKILKPFISLENHHAKYLLEIPYNARLYSKIKLGKKILW